MRRFVFLMGIYVILLMVGCSTYTPECTAEHSVIVPQSVSTQKEEMDESMIAALGAINHLYRFRDFTADPSFVAEYFDGEALEYFLSVYKDYEEDVPFSWEPSNDYYKQVNEELTRLDDNWYSCKTYYGPLEYVTSVHLGLNGRVDKFLIDLVFD